PHARAGGEERAVEVDRQHPTPVGVLEIDDRRDDLHARVRDQDVDAAQLLAGEGDAVVDLALVGDVHVHCQCGWTERFRGFGGALDVGDGDARALGDELSGDGAADSAGGAGDDRDLALQFHSGLLSRRESSPNIPRRNAITQTTKIAPSVTVTHEPTWAR